MSIALTPRDKEILAVLLGAGTFVPVESIAHRLNLSAKTIRNNIVNINTVLQRMQWGEIVKKPGSGICLQAGPQAKAAIGEMVAAVANSQLAAGADRKLWIIQKLLFPQGFITLQELANSLYTGRSSVIKLLPDIEDWFAKFGITLEKRQHYGIKLCYRELGWRQAVEAFYYLLRAARKADQKAEPLNQQSRLNAVDLDLLKQLFAGFSIDKIERLLNEFEKSVQIVFTYDSYLRLLLHLVLSTMRRRKGLAVAVPPDQAHEVAGLREYQMAVALARQLGDAFQVKFGADEIAYIATYLLVAEICAITDERSRPDIFADPGLRSFLGEFVQFIDNILDTTLNMDETLSNSLLLYLRPAIYRLKYGIPAENPFLPQIRDTYSRVFGAAWAASVLFEKHFNLKVSGAEIGFLAIYIEAALERAKRKVRAVLVCYHGVGLSQLITQSLRQAIPELEIDGVFSVYDYQKLNSADYDLVISTVPLAEQAKPVIYIDSILKPADIDRIKNQLRQDTKAKIRGQIRPDANTGDYLYEQALIFTELAAASKKAVIEKLVAALLQRGKVTEGFGPTVLDRETLTSTSVGQGIAIPHGSQQYVVESTIAVAVLKEPIPWAAGEQVDIVFLLAFDLKKNEANTRVKNFYAKFSLLLDDPAMIAKIRESQTPRELYEFLISAV